MVEEFLTCRQIVEGNLLAPLYGRTTACQVRRLIRTGALRSIQVGFGQVRPVRRVNREWIAEFILLRKDGKNDSSAHM